MKNRTNRTRRAATAVVVASVVALAAVSCTSSSSGPTAAQDVEGQAATERSDPSVLAAAAAATDAGERLPSRRTQYLPPREALVHRLYTIEPGDNRSQPMTRLWQGKVTSGIGDEIWTWQQVYNGRIFQGEALLRSRRVADGYVLRALNAGPTEAVPAPTTPAATEPAAVAPATGPAAAPPPTTQP